MERTIKDSIKYLTTMRKTYQADTEHLSIAIETMDKYLKIEQIMTEWENSGLMCNQLYDLIKEVLEDGQSIINN